MRGETLQVRWERESVCVCVCVWGTVVLKAEGKLLNYR